MSAGHVMSTVIEALKSIRRAFSLCLGIKIKPSN